MNKSAVESFENNISAKYIDALTEAGERVGFSTLDCDVMVMAGVVPASIQGGSVPWFWEQAGEQAMKELRSAPPRVFVFYKHQSVWGYHISDYAPELVEFINENYVRISDRTEIVWVLKSYYAEAKEIIDALE